MKIKELTGRALDYAVALAEGYLPEQLNTRTGYVFIVTGLYSPTTGRAGDDIIDREKISVYWADLDSLWHAYLMIRQPVEIIGTTRREAAMRAYVASKLGDEVEIPKELA